MAQAALLCWRNRPFRTPRFSQGRKAQGAVGRSFAQGRPPSRPAGQHVIVFRQEHDRGAQPNCSVHNQTNLASQDPYETADFHRCEALTLIGVSALLLTCCLQVRLQVQLLVPKAAIKRKIVFVSDERVRRGQYTLCITIACITTPHISPLKGALSLTRAFLGTARR